MQSISVFIDVAKFVDFRLIFSGKFPTNFQ